MTRRKSPTGKWQVWIPGAWVDEDDHVTPPAEPEHGSGPVVRRASPERERDDQLIREALEEVRAIKQRLVQVEEKARQ